MLTLLLASTLHLAPGVSLADHVEGRSARLGARIRFVRDDDDKRPSLDAMTREELSRELKRLETAMPGFGGPIAAMAVGFPLLGVGIGLLYLGVSTISFSGSTAFLIGFAAIVFGAAAAITGFIIGLIGTIKFATRFGARARHQEQIDEVQQTIDALDQALPPGAPPEIAPMPPPDIAPPPPPPLPPEANLVRPGPMMTIATF
jgi:hypothetical protein